MRPPLQSAGGTLCPPSHEHELPPDGPSGLKGALGCAPSTVCAECPFPLSADHSLHYCPRGAHRGSFLTPSSPSETPPPHQPSSVANSPQRQRSQATSFVYFGEHTLPPPRVYRPHRVLAVQRLLVSHLFGLCSPLQLDCTFPGSKSFVVNSVRASANEWVIKICCLLG